jgi:glycosyltransferase involved in cell wall biosynthesis
MKSWTVVIPIYNDTDCLRELLHQISKIEFPNGQFIIVDNGSSDRSVMEMSNHETKNVNFIRSDENLGFGGGIKLGIANSNSPWVGWMPGNLKVNPRELLYLESLILEGDADLIKASRTGRSFAPRTKTLLAGLMQSILVRKLIFDSGGTPTFLRREHLSFLRNSPSDYIFESYIYFMAKKSKLRILRPGVPYGERPFGQSHWQRGFKSEIKLLSRMFTESRKWK